MSVGEEERANALLVEKVDEPEDIQISSTDRNEQEERGEERQAGAEESTKD